MTTATPQPLSAYSRIVTGGTLIAIISCSFLLGVLFANWPYTDGLLWTVHESIEQREDAARRALSHYIHWLEIPKYIPYTMYVITGVGFLGLASKIISPNEDAKYYEYGSFVVFIIAVCCYISNVRFGAYSAQAGQWGEVDEFTGLTVIAASEVIIVFLLLGIVIIQSGIFYAQYEDDKIKADFLLKELKTKLAQQEFKEAQASKESNAKASGARVSNANNDNSTKRK